MKVKGAPYTYSVTKAEDGGYVARCIELPQVHTEEETLAEVKKSMRDALTLTVDYFHGRSDAPSCLNARRLSLSAPLRAEPLHDAPH
jgi:predicted RNase H-like HicB family nuclease